MYQGQYQSQYRTQFPKPPAETLPTMYDLPSEDPEELGLPDEFHDFQPKLLRETCKPTTYSNLEYFIGTDINLYYDSRHSGWYKRPDWFIALEVSPLGDRQTDLRWSYVVWEEGISPFIIVELLSPGTEDDDLGTKIRELGKPPTKWEVYERILRVPFYVIFDRYENDFRVFSLEGGRYQQQNLAEPKIWFEDLQLGLGVWEGRYQGFEGKWLRWYRTSGEWIPTDAEACQLAETQVERERSARQQAETQLEQERSARRSAIPRLLSLGLTTEQIAESLGLTIQEVEQSEG
jgi:Uma2 family endonuclease